MGVGLFTALRPRLRRLRHAAADSESVGAVVCRFHCETAGIAGSRGGRGGGRRDSGAAMTGGRTAIDDRVLLADIGGTNARFALMDRGEIGPVEHLKVADF